MTPPSVETIVDLLEEDLDVSRKSERLNSVYDDEIIAVLVRKSEINVSNDAAFTSEFLFTQKQRNKSQINSTTQESL